MATFEIGVTIFFGLMAFTFLYVVARLVPIP
jgi:hypothetical protein